MTIGPRFRPAAFIDRDGTLVEEVNFLSRVDDLLVFPFSAEAIRKLKERGFLISVSPSVSIGRKIDASGDEVIHDAIQSARNAIDAFFTAAPSSEG